MQTKKNKLHLHIYYVIVARVKEVSEHESHCAQELDVLTGFHTYLERSLCNQNNKDLKSLVIEGQSMNLHNKKNYCH